MIYKQLALKISKTNFDKVFLLLINHKVQQRYKTSMQPICAAKC
jgi:hypothetical protein